MFDEAAIRGTGQECAGQKLAVAQLDYYHDPYIQHFVYQPVRVTPVMNRGYFARIAGIRKAVESFFACVPKDETAWFINIGSGMDTLTFSILEKYPNVKAIDIDYAAVVREKATKLKQHEVLANALLGNTKSPSFANEPEIIDFQRYKLMVQDLVKPEELHEKLAAILGRDCKNPVIFLSECVLCYVPVEQSDSIIALTCRLTTGPRGFVLYEHTRPDDRFGQAMVQNFNIRQCPIQSIFKYPTPSSQEIRFTSRGWQTADAIDMNQLYDHYIDREEKVRIQKLELLDELEELRLLQSHYTLMIAAAGVQEGDESWQGFLDIWKHPYPPEPVIRFTTEEFRGRSTS